MGSTHPRYALVPVFCVRAAGVPFDALLALGTPAVAAAARELLAAEGAVDRAGGNLLAQSALPAGRARRKLARCVAERRAIPDELRGATGALEAYERAVKELAGAAARLEEALDREARRVHREVRRHAVEVLPDFAAIEAESMLDELERLAAAPPPDGPPRSPERKTDRALALYLQRVCSKNDTISRFGPSGWGRVEEGLAGLRIHPEPGLSARRVEVERWVVAALVEVMNRDPAVRAEVCPRLHPEARLEGGALVRIDTGAEIALAPGEWDLLGRCDGRTPAHVLGDLDALARLADAGALIWELERYAIDASPLASLIADVAGWREEARARWLPRLERLRELARAFGEAAGAAARRGALAAFRAELGELGVGGRERGRTLYAAANPISENCYRESGVALGAGDAERLIADAAPWFDLFRDACALAVGRAFERYRQLVREAPRRAGRLTYAELVAFGRARGVQIDSDATLLQIGISTFEDVKRAFAGALAGRPDAPEWRLSADDCAVLRRQHDLPDPLELGYPQADLQIAAPSLEAVAAGHYTWVVAELHLPFTPLQHGIYWSCPDKPRLRAAMARVMGGRPFLVRDFMTAAPVHISPEPVFDATPAPVFVGRGRPKPTWRAVRPADAEVVLDEGARDVRLRAPSGEDLGSLIRSPRMVMGLHPFFPLERAPHCPRLLLGEVVVQRRSWVVTSDEVGADRPVGVSAALVAGIERMRADRGVPRWVFVRPTPAALRMHDVNARDKDLKPFYADLESTLFLDILERRLRKYGELVLTEMLPAPDQLVWAEPAGRIAFELRTSLMPRREEAPGE